MPYLVMTKVCMYYICVFIMLLRISRSLFSTSAELVRVQKLKDKYSNIVSIELNQPKKKNALSIALLNQVPWIFS
jgi:hypothetical protein